MAVWFCEKQAGEGGRGERHFAKGVNVHGIWNILSLSSSDDSVSVTDSFTSLCRKESERYA